MEDASRMGARAAQAGVVLALLAMVLLIGAGPGTRAGMWTFRTGFTIMRWAAYGGIAAAVLGLAGIVAARGAARSTVLGVTAVLLGLTTAAVPWSWRRAARTVPPIHDITTDLERPPEFVAVLPLRADAPNPAEYGGPDVARQQREAYPSLGPLTLTQPPDAAFALALEAARGMGWEIVAADADAGRIEATSETKWFGFKDDVVVRVEPADGGTRVDVRSVSRVGGSDVGTNARRIRSYLERLGELAGAG